MKVKEESKKVGLKLNIQKTLPEPGFMPVLGTSEGVLTAEYEPGC